MFYDGERVKSICWKPRKHSEVFCPHLLAFLQGQKVVFFLAPILSILGFIFAFFVSICKIWNYQVLPLYLGNLHFMSKMLSINSNIYLHWSFWEISPKPVLSKTLLLHIFIFLAISAIDHAMVCNLAPPTANSALSSNQHVLNIPTSPLTWHTY